MNTHTSIRISRIAVVAIASALVFVAFWQAAFVIKASPETQGKGRRYVVRPSQDSQFEQNLSPSSENSSQTFDAKKPLRLDIAENGTKFTFDETPVFDDGFPAFGNEFVTEGYVYPAGTLNGPNGVNPDGSPQFPDKVIGKWVCRGFHVGDGAHTVTGPWVITHQLFDLGNRPGSVTIATDGYETPEVGAPIDRAITGGTGTFSEIRGDSSQTFLGFNSSNGVTLRVEIRPSKK